MAVVLVDQDGVLAGFEQGLFGAFKAKHPNGPVVAVADRRGFYAREHYGKLGPEWGNGSMRSSAPRASTATWTRSTAHWRRWRRCARLAITCSYAPRR
jgi:hypothetical protein